MRRKIALAFMVLNLFSGVTANADVLDQISVNEKSPKTATRLSLWSTVLPSSVCLGVAVIGAWEEEIYDYFYEPACIIFSFGMILVGPSTGYFYSEEYVLGLKKIGLRAGMTAGAFAAFGGAFMFGFNREDWSQGIAMTFTAISVLLSWGIVASAVYDILNADESAERYNQKINQQRGFYLQPQAARGKYHVQLGYRF